MGIKTMPKKQSTDTAIATEVAELKAQVAALIAAFTEPTKATPKAAKPSKKARKSNGNKWLAKFNGSKVWEAMPDQGSTAKNKAAWAKANEAKVPLMLQKVDGSSRTWNTAS